MTNNGNPFEVPPFDPGSKKQSTYYYWWSWHPNYPYWSKSCWGGATIAEAYAALESPMACKMKYYHNKLIQEGGLTFVEVVDKPCERLDVWRRIAEEQTATKK